MATELSTTELEQLGLNPKALAPFSEDQKKLAIQSAIDEAESYLRRAMGTPLPTTPLGVKVQIARIAVYTLLSVRGMDPDRDQLVIDNYKRAIAFLEGVAKGAIQLDVSATTPPADSPADDFDAPESFSDYDRGFGGRYV